ncbi:MAG: type II toxin-antitoxin system VapC family toxin [Rhodospirillales bacterium]|nr:type II toxin-antitoxin system VapC family toxin [Rhodospirillales bacterium]
MTFVIDASICAAWCFPDEKSETADQAFDRLLQEHAVGPALWWFEIRNILVMGERRQRISAASADEFLSDLEKLPIHIDLEPQSQHVMALSKKHRLSVYDAAYLELALRLQTPLVTLDEALHTAVRQETQSPL